jgi:hypothetical protein
MLSRPYSLSDSNIEKVIGYYTKFLHVELHENLMKSLSVTLSEVCFVLNQQIPRVFMVQYLEFVWKLIYNRV